jgi:hypothetical protein
MPQLQSIEKLLESASLPYFIKVTEESTPRVALYIDNHLISTHNFCERKFYWQHMRRLRLKGPGGFAMGIGGWWSAVLEDFYNLCKEAQSVSMVPYTSNSNLNPLAQYPTRTDFIERAAKRWRESKMDELQQFRPKQFKEFGETAGAALMAMSYYDTLGRSDFSNWKIVGSELGFGQRGEVLLYEDDKLIIYYMGKPDLVVYTDGGNTLMPVEHKTIHRIMSNTHTKYKPHPQIEGYVYSLNKVARELCGYDKPVDRCIVNIASRALPAEKPKDGVKKPRFTRVFINYSEAELEEWKENVVNKAKRLYHSLIEDEWLWKDGPNTCHLYGGCEYRGIDSRAPGMRELVIASDFVAIEPWTPYLIEDEDDEEA